MIQWNERKEFNLFLFLIQCIMIKQQGHIRSVWMSVGVGFQPPTPVRSCITVPPLLDPPVWIFTLLPYHRHLPLVSLEPFSSPVSWHDLQVYHMIPLSIYNVTLIIHTFMYIFTLLFVNTLWYPFVSCYNYCFKTHFK